MISADEQTVVDALNRGLVDTDGVLTCPVCGDVQRVQQSYGPHWRRAHFGKLSKAAQLEVDGMHDCEQCGMVVANIAVHRRDHHGKSKAPARVNGTARKPTQPEQAVDADDSDDEPRVVTPVDAGLAILAGLRPGSSITVEQLPDVVEWLQSTEHVVGLFKR